MEKDLIKERILKEIENGKEKMRSRYSFYSIKAFWSFSVLVLILFLVFLISFIIFSGQQSGLSILWQFGIPGVINFMLSLPWLMILGCILVFLLIHRFLREKSIIYKKPVIYTFLILLFLIIGAGTIMAKTSVHENIISLVKQNNLSEVSKIYQKYTHRKAKGLYVGTVSEVGKGKVVVKDNQGKKTTVDVDEKSENELKNNDTIIIFGKNQHGKVKAIKIKQIENKAEKIRMK